MPVPNDELERRIRNLEQVLAGYRQQGFDGSGLRIRNVAPSRDQNDVVVRRELAQFAVASTPQTVKTSGGSSSGEVGVFGCFISSPLEVKSNITQPHIVKAAGTLNKLYATLRTPVSSGNVVFSLYKNEPYKDGQPKDDNKVLECKLDTDQDFLPALVTTTDKLQLFYSDNAKFVEGDVITIDIMQIGNEFPGLGLEVKFTYA